jgi:hypothetical protein
MTGPSDPAFFGYGSLVNRATHSYATAAPAILTGWRRVWRHTRLRPFAYLSVEPAEARIDGLIAQVPGGDWTVLDEREGAYRRHAVAPPMLSQAPGWARIVEIYAINPKHADPEARHPILLSYLDTVVQGFLREFGEAGVERFFASTAGWSRLFDDRTNPIYPRHQALTAQERGLVDAHIAAMDIARIGRP